ncbi:dynein light intermediate chain [Pelomyxa schiedti]|nr:dynein light intermediate chain [Pelomyxa schiedti]
MRTSSSRSPLSSPLLVASSPLSSSLSSSAGESGVATASSSSASASSSSGSASMSSSSWCQLLREASRMKTATEEPKHIIVLGDRGSGKSEVIRSFDEGLSEDPTHPGLGLDYNYIEIEGEDLMTLNVWDLEGDPKHSKLLNLALTKENFAHSVILIVIDFQQPWNMNQSLTKWLSVLQEHITNLNMEPKEMDTHQKTLHCRFLTYADVEQAYNSPPDAGTNPLKRKYNFRYEGQSLVPLPPGVLAQNLGIPIIIACSKVEFLKGMGLSEPYLDFIELHLRRICLRYGASLVFCSTKRQTNTDVLFDYILFHLYGIHLEHKVNIVDRERLFIPCGWDSAAKIDLDFQTRPQVSTDPNAPFETVIKDPSTSTKRADFREPSETAEDDQQFLKKLKELLDKTPLAEKTPAVTSGKSLHMSVVMPSTDLDGSKAPGGAKSGLLSRPTATTPPLTSPAASSTPHKPHGSRTKAPSTKPSTILTSQQQE